MTKDDVVQAIDGAVVEVEGQKWTLAGTRIESIGIAGQQWAVRFTIAGPRDRPGELVVTPSRYEAQELRELAVTHAQDIITGRLPPGARELI